MQSQGMTLFWNFARRIAMQVRLLRIQFSHQNGLFGAEKSQRMGVLNVVIHLLKLHRKQKMLFTKTQQILACAKFCVRQACFSPTLLVGIRMIEFNQISQQFAVVVHQSTCKVFNSNFFAADVRRHEFGFHELLN